MKAIFVTGICLMLTGCIMPKHSFEIDLAQSRMAADSIWEEANGEYEYSASRPDGTFVKLKVKRTNALDAATQAAIAQQQTIANSIAAGIQLGQTAVNGYLGRPASQPAN